VDFLRYYAANAPEAEPVGTFTCISPWNFPLAIFTGQIAAALAAGNAVLSKPAEQTPLIAHLAVRLMHKAGVPETALQLLPGAGQVGAALTSDARVGGVAFTGSTDTALKIRAAMVKNLTPGAPLIAETGGMNAMIVDSTALPEQAVQAIVESAFQSAGQRCSGLRCLYVQEDIAEGFTEMLTGAMDALHVGHPWHLSTDCGPVIDEEARAGIAEHIQQARSEGRLLHELKTPNVGTFIAPTLIKVGGIEDMEREVFGPVLHLATFTSRNLDKVIGAINATGYGLTSGIESLDEREVEYWKKNIRAGNLYINRGTTGAIVLRQPFGGLNKSAIGAGRKTGHYNYVSLFMDVKETRRPQTTEKRTSRLTKLADRWDTDSRYAGYSEQISNLQAALQSYLKNYEVEFLKERDYFKLRGEDNIFKYLKVQQVALRICEGDTLFDSMARIFAAKVCGVAIRVSLEETMTNPISQFLFRYSSKILKEGDVIKRESEADFSKCFSQVDRIMYAKPENISSYIFERAAEELTFIVRTAPLMEGRLELLNFFEEQSISHSFHRYGNLGGRSLRNS
jgi:delta-1-pyrroline-5-carboxylate dehydrogenase PutA-like protein